MACWRAAADGIEIFARVTPNAKTDHIGSPLTRDDGSTWLAVRVRAVPDRGRANKAVIALIADWLGAPPSAITIRSGETGRQKILHVAGDPAALEAAAKNRLAS